MDKHNQRKRDDKNKNPKEDGKDAQPEDDIVVNEKDNIFDRIDWEFSFVRKDQVSNNRIITTSSINRT